LCKFGLSEYKQRIIDKRTKRLNELEKKKRINKINKEKILLEKKRLAKEMYVYLNDNGYKMTMNKYGYNYKQGVYQFIKKYNEEFEPTNGKTRGK
jgi:hypothetical protein